MSDELGGSFDVLLEACRVAPAVYSLSGPFSRVSVRDAMWRAQTLCERLHFSGKLRRRASVLIVGGGVSGMVSAVTALDLGARVTLIEHSDKLAARQAEAHFR